MFQYYFAPWKRPFDLKSVLFLVFLVVFAIPTQAKIVQLSCEEERSYLIKNKRKEDYNRLIISPASFIENDSSKVWRVSYDLLNGVASIDESKVKVTGNNALLGNVPQPVLLSFGSDSFDLSEEIVKEGFFPFNTEKLIEKTKLKTEINY